MTPPAIPGDWQRMIDRVVAKYEPCGRVTIDELNEELPAHEVTSTFIEEVYGALYRHGIDVVEE
jgi:hypothetical protein